MFRKAPLGKRGYGWLPLYMAGYRYTWLATATHLALTLSLKITSSCDYEGTVGKTWIWLATAIPGWLLGYVVRYSTHVALTLSLKITS